ncbi:MAG: AsmA family protein [Candidatus Omnitrophica bacterium]|jgi:hypothetical protein|nr:AsmA family protein [Candidatus Omnitrophota bacterium]
MIKYLNLIKISIILVMLVVFNFAIGLFISPAVTQFIIAQLNKNTAAKISIDKAQVWPLTLSVKLINLKIFDTDDVKKRILSVPEASCRLSLLGILSKRAVISHAVLNDAEISLERREDGSFNIQNIIKHKLPSKATEKPVDMETPKKENTLSGAYNVIKDIFSKKHAEEAAQKRKEDKRVTETIENLPQGKLVHFKTVKYLLEIVDLDFNNAAVSFKTAEGNTIEITKAKIQLRDFAFDPKLGMQLGGFIINATLSKDKITLGGISAKGTIRYVHDEPNVNLDIQLTEVNPKPLEFIYRDSLPVTIEKGRINFNSKTNISPDNLDSKNTFQLKEFFLSPKQNGELIRGFIPVDLVCDALNKQSMIGLNFNITGTPDAPELTGFRESLNKLLDPIVNEIAERIQQQGFQALENYLKKKNGVDLTPAETQPGGEGQQINPVDILKSILGGKEESK